MSDEMPKPVGRLRQWADRFLLRFGYRRDDPFWDGSDFAHPAWWRGNDQGVVVFCKEVNSILNGAPVQGFSSEPWQSLRKRLQSLTPDPIGITLKGKAIPVPGGWSSEKVQALWDAIARDDFVLVASMYREAGWIVEMGVKAPGQGAYAVTMPLPSLPVVRMEFPYG